ncbi:hypothetical protein [Reyranella sp.]|uniref:hypothetical protein n=1 Tax=Reyranella sp. TaxID=1929291 RepID=UPI003BABF5D3
MPSLNLPTLNLISVIVTLVSAGVSLLTWYHHRGGPGLRGWALALLLGSAGSYLYSLRGPDTSFRLILTGNALYVAGFAAMWVSMRRFNDPSLASELMAATTVAITTVFVLLFVLAWKAGPGVRAQSIVFSLFVFSLTTAAAWETWRGRRLDGLRSRSVAAIALAGIALVPLMRAAAVTLVGMGLLDIADWATIRNYGNYATTVFILVVTFGLVLMANERFERQYAQQLDELDARP